jgi:hypothetical protein
MLFIVSCTLPFIRAGREREKNLAMVVTFQVSHFITALLPWSTVASEGSGSLRGCLPSSKQAAV